MKCGTAQETVLRALNLRNKTPKRKSDLKKQMLMTLVKIRMFSLSLYLVLKGFGPQMQVNSMKLTCLIYKSEMSIT